MGLGGSHGKVGGVAFMASQKHAFHQKLEAERGETSTPSYETKKDHSDSLNMIYVYIYTLYDVLEWWHGLRNNHSYGRDYRAEKNKDRRMRYHFLALY